MTLQVRR
jgi:hypothetical protein